MLAEALARHISREAGALMTAGPFALSSPEELRALLVVGEGVALDGRGEAALARQAELLEVDVASGLVDASEASGDDNRNPTLLRLLAFERAAYTVTKGEITKFDSSPGKNPAGILCPAWVNIDMRKPARATVDGNAFPCRRIRSRGRTSTNPARVP